MANFSRERQSVVVLIDMDCFYVQVEQRENPNLKGKPVAVVQYNQWKGGAIIAVGYEARARGVTRNMRGEEALKKCPDIQLVTVPSQRGKADLTKYRLAGAEVIKVFCQTCNHVERASVDEAYIELTSSCLVNENIPTELDNTHVVGFSDTAQGPGVNQWLQDISDDDVLLAKAAGLVSRLRQAVYDQTGFRCSAGISLNKTLSKLACGVYKPNKQTVLPAAHVMTLFEKTPISKVRGLGGKMGEEVQQRLQVSTMAELARVPEASLVKLFPEGGHWLHQLSHGLDWEPISQRLLPLSVGCSKNFPGKQALSTVKQVKHWLSALSAELVERLQAEETENNRTCRLLIVSVTPEGSVSRRRSCPLASSQWSSGRLPGIALDLAAAFNTSHCESPAVEEQQEGDLPWTPPVVSLGISGSKFESLAKKGSSLDSLFKKQQEAAAAVPKEEHGGVGGRRSDTPREHQYTPESIDLSVVDELPDDIRNEIRRSLPSAVRPEVSKPDKPHASSTSKPLGSRGISAFLTKSRVEPAKTAPSPTVSSSESPTSAAEERTLPSKSLMEAGPSADAASQSRTDVNVIGHEADDETAGAGDDEDRATTRCDRCGATVTDAAVHADFHFARDLQNELHGSPLSSVQNSSGVEKRPRNIRDFFNPKKAKLS